MDYLSSKILNGLFFKQESARTILQEIVCMDYHSSKSPHGLSFKQVSTETILWARVSMDYLTSKSLYGLSFKQESAWTILQARVHMDYRLSKNPHGLSFKQESARTNWWVWILKSKFVNVYFFESKSAKNEFACINLHLRNCMYETNTYAQVESSHKIY